MKTLSSLSGALFLLTALLIACGGGGGNDPAPSGGNPNPPGGGVNSGGVNTGSSASGASYLFYTGGLSAVDPASPTSPITVEAGDDFVTVSAFESGTYNSTTKTVTSLHTHALLYAKDDGKLYKVSALKSGSLMPVQVSSESEADELCEGATALSAVTDFAHPDDSQYVYALPGADGDCETGDDEWKMVRLGMGASDVPVMAKRPVAELGDFATGAIAGWLVFEAGALKKCDAAFANCGAPLKTVVGAPQFGDFVQLGLGLNDRVLEIDGEIFVYDGQTNNTLSAPVFAVPTGTVAGPFAADDSHVYFAHEKTIYRFPADGSAAVTVVAVEAEDIIAGQMATTASNVVYHTGAKGAGKHLRAVAKTGGTSSVLASAAGTDDLMLMAVAGNRIYYNIRNTGIVNGMFTVTPVAAGVVDENGGGKSEQAGAYWIAGGTYPTTVDFSKTGTQGFQPQRVIRADASGTLTSFDTATSASVASLGFLPADVDIAACYGIGDATLCSATVQIIPAPALPALPFQTDVFFLNAATANSLTQVTDTADKNEVPVF